MDNVIKPIEEATRNKDKEIERKQQENASEEHSQSNETGTSSLKFNYRTAPCTCRLCISISRYTLANKTDFRQWQYIQILIQRRISFYC